MKIIEQLKRVNARIDIVQKQCENLRPRIIIYLDMLVCILRYGCYIEDYFVFRLWRFKHCERKKFTSAKRQALLINTTCAPECKQQLDDKATFNRLFDKYLKRDWLELPGCSLEQFEAFTKKHIEFVAKPVGGYQGTGVRLESTEGRTGEEIYEALCNEHVVIEERLTQYAEMAEFNEASINTFRVVTILCRDGARVVTSAMRMGRKNCVIDNFCNGGVAAVVDPDLGIVSSAATDGSARFHLVHPDSGK